MLALWLSPLQRLKVFEISSNTWPVAVLVVNASLDVYFVMSRLAPLTPPSLKPDLLLEGDTYVIDLRSVDLSLRVRTTDHVLRFVLRRYFTASPV